MAGVTPSGGFEFLRQRFGGIISHSDFTFVVGVTWSRLLQGDPERLSVVFVNLGADFVTLSPTHRGALNEGIRLSPNGGAVFISVEEDTVLPSLEWFAISGVAAQSLYVLSTRRESKL